MSVEIGYIGDSMLREWCDKNNIDTPEDGMFDQDILYRFFDQEGIIVTVYNDHTKGTNVWGFKISYWKDACVRIFERYGSRKEAEEAAFTEAFRLYETLDK